MLTRPASNVEDSTSQLARTGQGEKNRLWVPDIPRRGAPLLVDPAVKVGPGLTGARDILHGPRLFVGDGRLQSLSRYRGRMSSPRVPGGVVHRLPPDLRKALVANSTVLDAWRDITPLARNEFICWVEDAKQDMTRERRIRRTGEELEQGQRRPCCWPGCRHRERNGS